MRALLVAIWMGVIGAAAAGAQDFPPPPAGDLAAPASRMAVDPRLAETIIYYYIDKDIATLPVVFDAFKDGDMIRRSGLSRAALAGFLSMVFVQNRSRIENWIGSGDDYPFASKAVLEFALWQSGNANLIFPLFHEQPGFVSDKPGNLYSLIPRSPVEMDLKWGAFYATGNPGFVGAMVDALDRSHPLTGSRELDVAIRKASVLGLAYNMRQHEMIERLVRKREVVADGAYKEALDALLADRQAQVKPAPDHDGDFSAFLSTVKLPDDAVAARAAVEIVPGGGPRTARRGDTLGVTLFFSGMQLADDLSADVSYDIKITGPDGTVNPASSQTDVAALREKVPVRFNLMDSASTLSLHFLPEDKAGPYRIDVVVKDNIGGKRVALSRSVELLDK